MFQELEDAVEQEFKFLTLNGSPLKLYVSPSLFMPNQTTNAIAEAIEVSEGEIGIELGAGIGPLTILMAFQPIKHLYSVELVEAQCGLARKNIARYNLEKKVSFYQGNLFEPIEKAHPQLKADFIFSDISGMAEDPGRMLGWYPPAIPTGDVDGTDKIIPVIMQSSQYLKPNGRFYFPIVVNFSDRDKILNIAQQHFNALELLSTTKIPLTQELIAIIDTLKTGLYTPIERRGSRGRWHLEIYKATCPK